VGFAVGTFDNWRAESNGRHGWIRTTDLLRVKQAL